MISNKIFVTYNLVFEKESVDRSIDLLLAEMTSGIQYYSTKDGPKMDRIQDNVPYVNNSVQGEVISKKQMDDNTYLVEFGFPATNLDVELGGITNLWPIVAGEVFNFHFIKQASLVSLELPDSFKKYYLGPRLGISGIRSFLSKNGCPIFGAIIKPNIGLDPKRSSEVVSMLINAGFDFVKDDEICVSPYISSLKERVSSISKVIEEYKQSTGRNVLYAANVTSDFAVLGRCAEIALNSGANALMIDPFCTGLSAVDYLRRNFDAPIYAHRVGYGIYCLNPKYNIHFSFFTKLLRLVGADFSHVGGIWGGSQKSRDLVKELIIILREKSNIKTTWPVVTGISLDSMKEYYEFYGNDTLFMEHIDIFKDFGSAKKKLNLLKGHCLI
jgi:ribulose 1,5-bisphosphate carboxylase large subunit-like protein